MIILKTKKPISTISYNTEHFLKNYLDSLIYCGKIEFYTFIKHNGEFDPILQIIEKDHYHVFIVPNGQIDTEEIKKGSEEFDLDNDKPLKFMDIRNSKEADAYLYFQHNEEYLISKCLTKQFHYTLDDFISSDDDEFYTRYSRAVSESDFNKNKQLRDLLKCSSASDLAFNGYIQPMQSMQMLAYEKLINRAQHKLNQRDFQIEKIIELEKQISSLELEKKQYLSNWQQIDIEFENISN